MRLAFIRSDEPRPKEKMSNVRTPAKILVKSDNEWEKVIIHHIELGNIVSFYTKKQRTQETQNVLNSK